MKYSGCLTACKIDSNYPCKVVIKRGRAARGLAELGMERHGLAQYRVFPCLDSVIFCIIK